MAFLKLGAKVKVKNDKTKLTLHHIGARYGNDAFPALPQFEQDFIKILYDADADCIEEAAEQNEQSLSDVRVLPYCIAENSTESTPFHINNDPFTSSLYKLNEAHRAKYTHVYGFDYLLEDAFSVNRTVNIETISIDELLNSKTNIPAPDFLSLDVQGAELDILKGAQTALQEQVLGLCLEVEFTAIYQNQAKFGEICDFLEQYDFEFARFLDIHEFTPYRGPIGVRGDGYHSYANALFLKKPQAVVNHTCKFALPKLAFISIIYNQVELAYQSLELACFLPDERYVGVQQNTSYLAFIHEVARLMQQIPQHYPPRFSDILASENGKDYPNQHFFSYVYQTEKVVKFLFEKLSNQPKQYSALEDKCNEYGLHQQADTLWANRVKHSLLDKQLCEGILKQIPEDTRFFSSYLSYLKSFTIASNENAHSYLEAALQQMSTLLELGKSNNELALIYGIASFLKSKELCEEATHLFSKLKDSLEKIGQSPLLGNTLFHLGELQYRQENFVAAKKSFQACLACIPNHRKATAYLATLQ